jgi:hypothetical protein
MKFTIIILGAALIIAAGLFFWRRTAARKYVKLDDPEFKEGEVTNINLGDLDPRDKMTQLFKETAKTQAAALDGAVVTIHSVTEHDRFREATPHPGQKLVAVDVTISGFKYGFGVAGIELLDVGGKDVESCGGDPYQVYLNADGTVHPKQGEGYWSGNDSGNSVRLFLVYSAPRSVRRVALGYWERVIVDRRYDVEPGKTRSTP